MGRDLIVEEIRQTRARLFARCGEDMGAFLGELKALEEGDKDRVVTMEALRKKRRAIGRGSVTRHT